MTFEDWFYEPEGFALRAERCWEDIQDYQGDNPEVILRWLKAAYTAGREHENLDWIQSHWDDGK